MHDLSNHGWQGGSLIVCKIGLEPLWMHLQSSYIQYSRIYRSQCYVSYCFQTESLMFASLLKEAYHSFATQLGRHVLDYRICNITSVPFTFLHCQYCFPQAYQISPHSQVINQAKIDSKQRNYQRHYRKCNSDCIVACHWPITFTHQLCLANSYT